MSSTLALPAFRRAANWFMASNLAVQCQGQQKTSKLCDAVKVTTSSQIKNFELSATLPGSLSTSDICCKSFGSPSRSDLPLSFKAADAYTAVRAHIMNVQCYVKLGAHARHKR